MNQLVAAHIEAQARLRRQAAAAIAAAWRALPSYDEATVPAFLATAVPTSLAAQRASVAVTNAFLARRLGRQPIDLDLTALIGAAVRNGTPPEEVYRRPFVNVWTALKDGKPHADAVASGLARATSSAEMDVQLSMRQTLDEVAQTDKRIVGYQRIPDGGACDLCLMASTQRYHSGDLMPIHNRCGCSVDVITGTEDPGRVIDRDLLRELKRSGRAGDLSYSQATSRARARALRNRAHAQDVRNELAKEADPKRRLRLDERAARYDARAAAQEQTAVEYGRQLADRRAARDGVTASVAHHGELGPVLVNGADHFTRL